MTMFSMGDDSGVSPSFYLGEITSVSVDDHTCSVELLRGADQYDDVLLMRDTGNFSLPKIGDLCAVLWDNRNRPIAIGIYPTFHKTDLDTNKNYRVQEGERLLQSEFGQKLLMTKSGKIALTNWLDSGIEVDEKTGMLSIKTTDAILEDADGVERRRGAVKRPSILTKAYNTVYSLLGGLPGDTGVTVAGVKKLIEDSLILIEEDTNTPIYEHRVGNILVKEGTTTGTGDGVTPETIDVETHSSTGNVLRSKTVFYSEGGLTGLTIEVDVDGNTKIDFPKTASEFKIEDATQHFVDLLMQFKKIDASVDELVLSATTSADINSATVNLGLSGFQALVMATVLPLLQNHTHPYLNVAAPSVTSPSLELATIATGTYETVNTKAS